MKTTEVNTLLKNYLLEKFSNSNVLRDTDLDFSFKLPNKKWENDTKTQNWINIYLLEVKDNLELRSTLLIRDPLNNTEKKPPYYIDLYYIITFYQNKPVDAGPVANMSAYDYMDTTLLAFYDFYDSTSYATLTDPKEMKLEMFPRPYSEEQLNLQLWSALDQDVRPFISLKVTIPLESSIAKDYTIVAEDGKKITYLHDEILYTLFGKVFAGDAGGEVPTIGATVEIKRGGDVIDKTKTNVLGDFAFKRLKNEVLTIHVNIDGYKTKMIDIDDLKKFNKAITLIINEKLP